MKKRTFLLVVSVHLILAMVAVGEILGEESVGEKSKSLTPALRQRCLEVLRRGLHSEEFWPALHAAEALTQAGQGKEVGAALKGRLAKERDDLKRCGLARELVRAGDRSKVTILLDILATSDLNGKIHAAESLYKVAEVGDGELLRKAMMQDDKVSLQLMAAAALARKGGPEALAVLRKGLAGTNADGKMLAAFVLGRLGDKRDIPQLLKNAQQEKDPLKKSFAHNALACLGDPKGKEVVAKNLEADDAGLRTYAAEAAGAARLTGLADRLTKLLDDQVLDVRVRGAQALLHLVMAKGPD